MKVMSMCIFNLIILIICTILFLIMSSGLFNQYARKDTFTKVFNEDVDFFDAPIIILCHKETFKKDVTDSDLNKEFLNVTYNIKDFVLSLSLLNDSGLMFKPEFRIQELYTVYRGRCLMIQSQTKVLNELCSF